MLQRFILVSDLNEQTVINNAEKLPVPNLNHILQNQEKQIISVNPAEAFSISDKKSIEFWYVSIYVLRVIRKQ